MEKLEKSLKKANKKARNVAVVKKVTAIPTHPEVLGRVVPGKMKIVDLFDGTLGDWNTEPVSFELKEGAKPYHGRAYPVPHSVKETLMKELKRLCDLGVKKKPWKWTEEHQKAFDDVKATIAKDVSLAYPDYSKGFEIYTDGSKRQLGAVITQNNWPIAFFSRKLSVCQQKYSVTKLNF
eukprot:CCRYP_001026-RA/>CCRYP_001026-RA protein AED:0.47 eAED:0.61 QI:0/0/0/1/0/0/3/0/178